MGSLSKLINDMDGAAEDEQAQKQRLEMLLALAKGKIDKFRTDLDERFSNPGLINKTQVPGTRAIRYIEQYHVASATQFNQQVADHLGHAIDAFFSLGDGNNKGAIQEGLKQVIQTGLSAFIGTTEVGESQDQMYFVVPENNAFVRVDVVCWKYHFDQAKILEQHDTAVAYVLCKSVIDHTQITLDELIYLVTQALSSGAFVDDKEKNKDLYKEPVDAAGVPAALGALGIKADDDVYKYLTAAGVIEYKSGSNPTTSIRRVQLTTNPDNDKRKIFWSTFVSRILSQDVPQIVVWAEADHKGQAGKYLTFKGNLDTATPAIRTNPAGLAVVEGYIDEMVRVWKKLSADR
ncbi:hypothetical protein [Paraburkholderia adhaesiva]|uniref:hypothetical protein n=1 Tax=Paraburkholderia adhaesiva TaxID=2883244 RepID=UPI001F1C67D4|nr:hypothetical protein [Paraburkholderia adhaesiva]